MSTLDDLAGTQGTSSDDPSGARAAQQAHDAGAVLPAVEYPTVACSIAFRYHGSPADADELVSELARALSGHPHVLGAVTTSAGVR